jgi:hypothetical protein
VCELVVERLDADGVDRRALTEAINLLARQQSSPLETPSQVLGGMVLASDVPRNGDGNGNGNGSGNGNDAHVDEIRLADYEEEPVSPFGTIEAFRPAEPFRAVDVIEPVSASEPVRTAEPVVTRRVGAWDAVPPPPRSQPVAAAPAFTPEPLPPAQVAHAHVAPVQVAPVQVAPVQVAPVQVAPVQVAPVQVAPVQVAPVQVAEPAPVVEPHRTYDAFAGLPLLQPVEPKAFEPVAPAPVVEPAPIVAPAEAEVTNGLDRQWNASHRLTETSTFRPYGGTRLTARRSPTRTSTR